MFLLQFLCILQEKKRGGEILYKHLFDKFNIDVIETFSITWLIVFNKC